MTFSNKTKNIFSKTSWIFIFFLGFFQINAQTSMEEEVNLFPFEMPVGSDIDGEFDFNDGMGAPVESLFASILPEGNVNISWKFNLDSSLQDFIIYKKQDEGNWEVYKNINVEEACTEKYKEATIQSFNFEDEGVRIGSKVEYSLVGRYVNGVKTEVSESLIVIF